HWPERIHAGGELRRTPAHIIDIVPTCLAAAGTTYPAQLGEHVLTPCEGKSLLPVFADDTLPARPLFWEHEGNRAVRVGDWKLVAKGKTGPWELYDLKADRTETNDLATKNPDRATAMAARWQAWAERCNVLPLCPKKPRGKGSKAKRFTLKQGQDLPAGKSPYVKRRPLRIKAELVDIPVNGTILAQGGSRAGYAMYVKDGCLAFTLRSKKGNGTVKAKTPLPKTATVELLLAKDASVRLSADGKEIAYGRVPELLYDMPTEGLQVGFDSGAAIGEYQGENRFTGKIRSLTLELDPK
ncbi:MAG: arylsulfatase, partial [Victivallales bacterium]|nr:arylsulfatase [Victivallales bacterium]